MENSGQAGLQEEGVLENFRQHRVFLEEASTSLGDKVKQISQIERFYIQCDSAFCNEGLDDRKKLQAVRA